MKSDNYFITCIQLSGRNPRLERLSLTKLKNNLMKKILFTFFAVVIATFAMAQGGNIEKKAQGRLTTMDKVVDMNPQQEKQMMPILVEHEKAKAASMKLKGSPEFQVRTKADFQKFMAGMKKVLTPEQVKKWQDHLKRQQAQQKQQPKPQPKK